MEMAGYDRIHYINTMYSWKGHLYRRLARTGITSEMPGRFSEAEYNPVGSYVKEFDLDEGLEGERVVVRFEEQAVYVFCNGVFIGYSEASFTSIKFDPSHCVRETGNVLCVEVNKRSTAAWLEEQDFFCFSGIFCSVNLFGLPANHIQDMFIHPQVQLETLSGQIEMELKMTGGSGKVRARICKDGATLVEKTYEAAKDLSLTIDTPEKVVLWQNGDPQLYTVETRVCDANGAVCEIVLWRFGLRSIELKDDIMLFNGKRLIIKGMNRHEWNASSGRVVSDADEKWDIECFHRHHGECS